MDSLDSVRIDSPDGSTPVVFTPSNEPYLGRVLLLQLDLLITAALEQNAATAPRSREQPDSVRHLMAGQTIAQALSLSLSIRELIRQGYLFGAHVLLRAVVERAAILLYLHLYPQEVVRWERGWERGDAPQLTEMLDKVLARVSQGPSTTGAQLTRAMNSLLHGKPDSAHWSISFFGNGEIGHSVSKLLDRADLCDDLCAQLIPWLAVVQAMMSAYFPPGSGASPR